MTAFMCTQTMTSAQVIHAEILALAPTTSDLTAATVFQASREISVKLVSILCEFNKYSM